MTTISSLGSFSSLIALPRMTSERPLEYVYQICKKDRDFRELYSRLQYQTCWYQHHICRFRGNQISKSIDGWRRTQLWYAWKTLLHPRPIPANLGFHMTCNRVWFSKPSSPSCQSGLNKTIFCLGNESNLWKSFTVGHFLGRVCHGGPSKMVSWVRQSYLWQIEFVFVLTCEGQFCHHCCSGHFWLSA